MSVVAGIVAACLIAMPPLVGSGLALAESKGGEKKDGGGHGGGKDGAGPQAPMGPPYFYDLPDMLINLQPTNKRPVFLKILVTVEVGAPEDIHTLLEVLPMVLDAMQFYLRQKKAEDLAGSVGMYRLRRDLMARIAAPAFPAKIKDVLFKELLVQ